MKKSIILSMTLIIFLVSISFAGCPPGYEPKSISGVFNYTYLGQPFTCHITVFFCCKWDINTHTIIVELDYMQSTYSNDCMGLIPEEKQGDMYDWAMELVIDKADSLCLLQYPPCDHPSLNYYTLEIKRPLCWYWENAFIPPYPGEEPIWILRTKKCSESSARCVVIWRVCYDYSNNPPLLQKTFVSRQIIGQSWNCINGRPKLPPPGNSWEEAWYTDCYLYDCQ